MVPSPQPRWNLGSEKKSLLKDIALEHSPFVFKFEGSMNVWKRMFCTCSPICITTNKCLVWVVDFWGVPVCIQNTYLKCTTRLERKDIGRHHDSWHGYSKEETKSHISSRNKNLEGFGLSTYSKIEILIKCEEFSKRIWK